MSDTSQRRGDAGRHVQSDPSALAAGAQGSSIIQYRARLRDKGGWALTQRTEKMGDIELEIVEEGSGAPLLFLHSGQGFDATHPFVGPFSQARRMIAPSHPGFGGSSLPDWLDRIDDIAFVYLELMDRLDLATVEIVGCSIGGWIAAELATIVPERISRLVLVGPVGVKTGPVGELDIPDIFVLGQDEVNDLLFHDADKYRMDPAKLSDAQLEKAVRNRESLALLTWEPYMHNPKLKHRLHRAAMPALLIRGAHDGLVSDSYLERYAALLPNARTMAIADAGHAPQIERPEQFTEAVLSFLDE